MTQPAHASGFDLKNEQDAARYTLTRDGALVSVLDYRDDGRTIALTRAFTIPTFRANGYAAEIVAGAVADIEARGDRKVNPSAGTSPTGSRPIRTRRICCADADRRHPPATRFLDSDS